MSRDQAKATESLTALFGKVDKNGNGTLEVDELKRVFGEHAEQFLQFCDADADRAITCEEWLTGILNDTADMTEEEFQANWVIRMNECITEAVANDGPAAVASDAEKIVDKINRRVAEGTTPFYSFEYFPPRTEDGVKNLYDRLDRMAKLNPLFMDFTWGAGGSTSDLTLELSTNCKKNTGLDVNMHLTCTNMPAEKVEAGLNGAIAGNIRNICALRGDKADGDDQWKATEGGFECALDLIKHIREKHGDHFGITLAGYPEGHPDNIKPVEDLGRELTDSEKTRLVVQPDGKQFVCSDEDMTVELDYLKAKVDAGGDVILTQLFYDADVFLSWVTACRAHGINCPIVPGIMPIQAYGGFTRMTGFCRTRIPAAVREAMDAIQSDTQEDKEAVKAYGITLATEMCQRILAESDCKGLHFYTLNLEKSVLAILGNLGLLPEEASTAVGANENEDTTKGTRVN
jgi:methylenetetrahydrofolate reductase (NADPH)